MDQRREVESQPDPKERVHQGQEAGLASAPCLSPTLHEGCWGRWEEQQLEGGSAWKAEAGEEAVEAEEEVEGGRICT